LNHFTVPFSLTEKLLSLIIKNKFPEVSDAAPNHTANGAPPQKIGETRLRLSVPKKFCPKAKDSSVHRRVQKLRRELWSPNPSALISTALLKTSTCLTRSFPAWTGL
jgi:hypothetical protein